MAKKPPEPQGGRKPDPFRSPGTLRRRVLLALLAVATVAAIAALINATVWGLAWIPLKWLEAHGVGTLWTTLFVFSA